MKVTDIKDKVIELTKNYFTNKGYALRPSDMEYVLKKKEITNIFRINIIAKTGWFIINTEVYFAHKGINQIHKTSVNKETKLTGPTSGFGVRNEHHDRGYYSVDTIKDVINSVDKIILDFKEIAEPFFNSVNTIDDVDKYFNNSQQVVGSQYSSCKALTAAYLNGNDYKSLTKKYYEFWKQSQGELAKVILETEIYLSDMDKKSITRY